jgi:NADH-quinone oxidoreductase subunit H
MLAKTAVPRYRFDQLMRFGWKVFLPYRWLWRLLWILAFCGRNNAFLLLR